MIRSPSGLEHFDRNWGVAVTLAYKHLTVIQALSVFQVWLLAIVMVHCTIYLSVYLSIYLSMFLYNNHWKYEHVSVCVCVFVYIYIYIYIYTHTHTGIYIPLCGEIPTSLLVVSLVTISRTGWYTHSFHTINDAFHVVEIKINNIILIFKTSLTYGVVFACVMARICGPVSYDLLL